MSLGTSLRRPATARGVERNARLTATTAVVLLVLLAAEGFTVLRVGRLLSAHVFIGALLIPPVLLKIASTTWRFSRYYLGEPAYRQKGPPPWALRVLGPAVVGLTAVLLGSGVALLYAGGSLRSELLFVHKASFILWFAAMTVHVLGHLSETGRLAQADWLGGAHRRLSGAAGRRGAVVASVFAGAILGALLLGQVSAYLMASPHVRPLH